MLQYPYHDSHACTDQLGLRAPSASTNYSVTNTTSATIHHPITSSAAYLRVSACPRAGAVVPVTLLGGVVGSRVVVYVQHVVGRPALRWKARGRRGRTPHLGMRLGGHYEEAGLWDEWKWSVNRCRSDRLSELLSVSAPALLVRNLKGLICERAPSVGRRVGQEIQGCQGDVQVLLGALGSTWELGVHLHWPVWEAWEVRARRVPPT